MRRRKALQGGAAAAAALILPLHAVRGADLLPLRVATIPSDTGSDVYYALEQGFFTSAGLDVDVQAIGNGEQIIGAISGGSFDLGAANTVAIANARIKGILLKIVAPGAVHTASVPTDLLMVAKTSTLRTARDLNGKTVAIAALGGLHAVVLPAWLAKNGGDARNVRLVELRFPAMAAALEAGRVDAAQMTEPFISSSRATVRSFADDYNAVADRFLIDGWVGSDTWIAQHPEEARRFALAMRNAHDWANAHHTESAAILVRHIKVESEVVDAMTRAGFGGALDGRLVQPLLDAATKYGVLGRPVAASEILLTR